MTGSSSKPSRLRIACAIGAFLLCWGLDFDSGNVTSAHAIIGRPLTPMSYAGVARRTTAVVGMTGAAVAAGAAAGAAAAATACRQVVDPYGRITVVCP